MPTAATAFLARRGRASGLLARPRAGLQLAALAWVCAALLAGATASAGDREPIPVFDQDVSRFTALLSSRAPERRIEGIQGLSHLRHWPAEEALLELLDDPSPTVQLEALRAVGRVATAVSLPRLAGLLRHPSWERAQNAALILERITARNCGPGSTEAWEAWWKTASLTNLQASLLTQSAGAAGDSRRRALRALEHLADPGHETALIAQLHRPGLEPAERNSVAEALHRVGTPKAIPALAGWRTDAAAWALGRIGGPAAEEALLQFPKTLATLVNLDRLRSTNAGPFLPHLVSQMGLVTYRGQPDDLMNAELQPIQRVGASLIRRSGLAPSFIHQTLLELEYTLQPPPAAPRPPLPEPWKNLLEAMRSELKPGFVREDGVTTSQPLTALSLVATDPALEPRLRPLLRHPAFVPRIYVAATLARLGATNALPDILGLILEGYPFSDSVALASGKHFDQSQPVRWRGFLCMALGRMGGETARLALERLAADAAQPRDIRYSSVVGLGFIGSFQSLPVLRRIASDDLIWMIREEARRVIDDLDILRKERSP